MRGLLAEIMLIMDAPVRAGSENSPNNSWLQQVQAALTQQNEDNLCELFMLQAKNLFTMYQRNIDESR